MIEEKQKLAIFVISELGGLNKVADICGITKSAVWQWKRNGIPKSWIKFFEEKYPDIFKKFSV